MNIDASHWQVIERKLGCKRDEIVWELQPFTPIPFPGERFCPVVENKEGHICSDPTVGYKEGIKVCKYHLAGKSKWDHVRINGDGHRWEQQMFVPARV